MTDSLNQINITPLTEKNKAAFYQLVNEYLPDSDPARLQEYNPLFPKAFLVMLENGNEDYKSRLQKIVQQTPEELLEYVPVSEEGPPHDRVFTFRVMLNSNCLGEGRGRTKREAEQHAARDALAVLGVLD